MSNTLTLRVDPQTERELMELTRDGSSRNAAIREAIHAAHRQQVLERVQAESQELLRNSRDLAEMGRVQEDMESIRAW